jgi:hypothetical protein
MNLDKHFSYESGQTLPQNMIRLDRWVALFAYARLSCFTAPNYVADLTLPLHRLCAEDAASRSQQEDHRPRRPRARLLQGPRARLAGYGWMDEPFPLPCSLCKLR